MLVKYRGTDQVEKIFKFAMISYRNQSKGEGDNE